MNTVGRLITRGVYTVSGPFHPFGGAVDIIVVEQPDGSFKSSPWYVRFGKFQGVLKAREKVVNINVNGIDANFHMYLDQRGEAYFLREVQEGDREESVSSSSSDEKEEQPPNSRRPMRSNSCNFDGIKSNSNGKFVARTNSRRSRIFGLVFGSRSLKEDDYQDGINNAGADVVRINSFDHAEIAADLLDVKWSNNLKSMKDNASDASDDKGADGQSQVGTVVQDATENSVDHVLSEKNGCNMQIGNSSQSKLENDKFSVQEITVESSSLSASGQVVLTSVLDEISLEEKTEEISSVSKNTCEPGLHNADHDDITKGVFSEVGCSDSQTVDVFGVFPRNKFDQEWVSGERTVALTGFGISEESGSNGIQSIYCGKSDNPLVGFDGSKVQAEETPCLTGGVPGDVNSCAETLHVTTKLPPEDSVTLQAEEIEMDSIFTKFCDDYPQLADPSPPVCGHVELNLEVQFTVPNSHSQMIVVNPVLDLTEVESKSISSSISSFTNSVCQSENGKSFGDKITRDELQPSVELVNGSAQLNVDCDLEKAVSVPVSENSEEEQFIFSDLDDFKERETQGNLNFSAVVEENNPSFSAEGTDEVNGPLSRNDESFSSQDSLFQKNQLADIEPLIDNSKGAARPISIPNLQSTTDMKVGWLGESLPNMWSCSDNMDTEDLHHPLSHSLDSDSRSFEWKLHSKDESCCINSDTDKDNQSSAESSNRKDSHLLEDMKISVANPDFGDPSEGIETTGGSWRLWPFTFRRSRSRKATQPTITDVRSFGAEDASSHSNIDMKYDENVVKPKASKRMVREITPTSEELASLNLKKDGSNTVTFTFSTAMLGRQKVDARIYLWKWNTRIVISDVDGTITKSDVLGQFMPLVGMDWSQTGVTPLFSAIKENGYQLLFLSARAISQAYHTRQFLVNLKQNGQALPDGPVVISPDGLFPSLFREVIRRAPHEFKIACLEEIKALFPSDRNPFYAGFGNRDTDEISYLKVGIPKGKIFIINPRGEVAVNRRVDTKSYTSLHALVHGMFPASSSEQEDYNSWNFWKLPPPVVDI